MSRGYFITFEGPDGGGKTTQIERLRLRLESIGHPVVKTREIGGTPEAEKIRDLVVRKSGGDWPPLAQLMLISTARYVHTVRVIQPGVEGGQIVLSDRYLDSTYVYQVAANGVDPAAFTTLNQLTLGNFKPDLTFILDVDADLAVARTGKSVQPNVAAAEKADDRFESQGSSLQKIVRNAYLKIASQEPGRCVVINAARSVDEVADDVWKIVEQRLNARG